jgi:hypothetical protein
LLPGSGRICRNIASACSSNIYTPQETGALLLAYKNQEETSPFETTMKGKGKKGEVGDPCPLTNSASI